MAHRGAKKRKGKAKGPHKEVVDGNLVKALAHPLRAQALAILNERVASPSDISKVLEKPVGNVSYHVKKLKDFGCVEMVKTAQRRGATEHYYRGVTRSFLNDENWAKLNAESKNGVSIAGLKMQNDASLAALEAGTFDARETRHLSCTPVNLDELGWGELTRLMNGTLDEVLEIQARCISRQAENDGDSLRATVSLLSFESPGGSPEEGEAQTD
jgi:DNA-binding transcriptional ArsR family regulator